MKFSDTVPAGYTTQPRVKNSDLIALGSVLAVLGFFALVPGALDTFKKLSSEHGFAMSFVKFAVLATFGECLALRITSGRYNKPGFGVLPKMIVWGILGVVIKMAFIIFAAGSPGVLGSLGLPIDLATMQSGSFTMKLLACFSISVFMNLIFAPVMMTLHKITDTHIHLHGGTLGSLTKAIDFAAILRKIDWQVMYHFVYKKTIPLFWIPAHTITFMLPAEYQILFAAALGIALGLILAFASSANNADTTNRSR